VLRQIPPNGNDNGVLAILETGNRAIFCIRFTGVWGPKSSLTAIQAVANCLTALFA